MDHVFVFVDTNIFLHYQPFDQINWCEVTGADKVTLVIAPVIIRELDKHKDYHHFSAVRERARAVLKKIRAVIVNGETLQFPTDTELIAVDEPNIDFTALHLDKTISDDYLIASCLAFKDTNPGIKIILASHDSGPLIKASRRGIKTADIPEKYKLPDLIDEKEKEIKTLRQQIAKLESRIPILDLSFANGEKYYEAEILPPQKITEEELARQLTELKDQFPKYHQPITVEKQNISPFASALARLSQFDLPSQEEINRYNIELDKYYQKYEEYLAQCEKYENIKRMTIQLDIILKNNGTIPAEDIDVFLRFPDGFSLYEEQNVPKEPPEPDLPQPPRKPSEITASLLSIRPSAYNFSMPTIFPAQSNISSLEIKKTNSYDVIFKVKRLKQYMNASPDTIYVVYNDFETASSFGIEYRINAANLPIEKTGTLHVVLKKAA